VIADIRIERLDAVPLAVVRRVAHRQELPHVVPASMGAVWNMLRAAGLRGGRNVAVYRDDAVTVDVGVEIQPGTPLPDGLVAAATPAGNVAAVAHYGPYGQLNVPHAALRAFCEEHSHRCAGPNWEIYAHWVTEWEQNPHLIRTDVYYLLAP
jgi:effector-binding domain-containing protein